MEALLPLLIIFAVMMLPMLWMSSRQRKAQLAHMEKVNSLGVGDEVVTRSGFYGLIVDSYDNVVILEDETGGQQKWARSMIQGLADEVTPGYMGMVPARPASTAAEENEPVEAPDSAVEDATELPRSDREAHQGRGHADVPGPTA